MTLPRRSADRVPSRGGWLDRLRRSRRARPRSGSAPGVDHGAWTVDRVVRALASACDRENRTNPAAHAIVVGPDTVWIRLATPDERPPAGWTVDHDGRTWHAQLRWLQSASVADQLGEPYPRLVSLGATSEGFVLLNLAQAGGIIALEGDPRQARTLAQDWTRELTTSPWSRGVRVVRVGFKPPAADPGATVEAKTLADAEAALTEPDGGVLLLAHPPGGRDHERIRGLADDPAEPWSVIVVGRVADPRWRFTLDSAGLVDTGLLDEPVARRSGPPADADPAPGETVPRRRWLGSLSTRTRIIAATVAAACVLGTAIFLAVPAIRGSANSTSPSASPSAASAAPKGVPAGGTGVIRSLTTGLCVDSDTNPAMSLNGTPKGGHAFSSACNGTDSQRWTEGPLLSQDSPRAGDMYRLVDRQTGFCLDSNNDGIYTLPCLNPDGYQVWQRVKLPASASKGRPPGDPAIAYRDLATNRCLSVSTAAQHALQTRPCPTTTTWPDDMLFHRPN